MWSTLTSQHCPTLVKLFCSPIVLEALGTNEPLSYLNPFPASQKKKKNKKTMVHYGNWWYRAEANTRTVFGWKNFINNSLDWTTPSGTHSGCNLKRIRFQKLLTSSWLLLRGKIFCTLSYLILITNIWGGIFISSLLSNEALLVKGYAHDLLLVSTTN